MTIDHVRPRDKAGPNWDSPDNKVVACGECNFIKRTWINAMMLAHSTDRARRILSQAHRSPFNPTTADGIEITKP